MKFGRSNEVSKAIKNLSGMLKYSIDTDTNIVTFVDEIEHIKAYEKILTQDDLNADIERILHQFNRMGRKYFEMSKCRKIVIRGRNPKVAFASGNSLHNNENLEFDYQL